MRLYGIAGAAVAAIALFSTPTFAQLTEEQIAEAQAAIDESGVEEPLYQYLWCGSAFMLVKTRLEEAGSTADAATVTPLMDAVYTKAATEAIAAGIEEADFVALSAHFNTLVASQTAEGAEADYAQEDCVAAAQP